jgi:hypothetical protein
MGGVGEVLQEGFLLLVPIRGRGERVRWRRNCGCIPLDDGASRCNMVRVCLNTLDSMLRSHSMRGNVPWRIGERNIRSSLHVHYSSHISCSPCLGACVSLSTSDSDEPIAEKRDQNFKFDWPRRN